MFRGVAAVVLKSQATRARPVPVAEPRFAVKSAVQCCTHCITLYIVYCTLRVYSIHCTVCNVQCSLYGLQCTLNTERCTLNAVHCSLYSIQCTLNGVLCVVQCTLAGQGR